MDWKKAKTLMIYVFIIIDIFLAYKLYVSKRTQVENFDIEPILNKYQITLDTKIPSPIKKNLIEVNYKTFTDEDIVKTFFDSPKIESTPDSSIFTESTRNLVLLNRKQILYSDVPENRNNKIKTSEDAVMEAEKFLEEKDLYFNLQLQKCSNVDLNSFAVEFEQIDPKSKLILEDAFAIVYVSENGVTGLKYQTFSSVVEVSSNVEIKYPKRKLLKIVKDPIAKGRSIINVSYNYYFNPSNLPNVKNRDKATSGLAKLALRVMLDNGAIIQID